MARLLETFPIHLGGGATAVPQPEFPRDERAMDWYMAYGERHAADGTEGRLVSCFRFLKIGPGGKCIRPATKWWSVSRAR